MKKIKLILFLICLSIIPILNVDAATITNVKYENSKFSVSGIGAGQVQIVIFDQNNNPIYMRTSETKSGVFTKTMPQISNIKSGTYTIKVAEYDGTNTNTKQIIIKSSDIIVKNKENGTITASKEENPKTYDSILFYVKIATISLLGMVTIIYKKRKLN